MLGFKAAGYKIGFNIIEVAEQIYIAFDSAFSSKSGIGFQRVNPQNHKLEAYATFACRAVYRAVSV